MANQRSTSLATQEDLARQVEQLRADVGEITRTLGDMSRGQVTELRARAGQRAAEIRDRGRESVEHAAERAREVERQAEDYVRERPVQALAIAAGLGLAIGYLTRRR